MNKKVVILHPKKSVANQPPDAGLDFEALDLADQRWLPKLAELRDKLISQRFATIAVVGYSLIYALPRIPMWTIVYFWLSLTLAAVIVPYGRTAEQRQHKA